MKNLKTGGAEISVPCGLGQLYRFLSPCRHPAEELRRNAKQSCGRRIPTRRVLPAASRHSCPFDRAVVRGRRGCVRRPPPWSPPF